MDNATQQQPTFGEDTAERPHHRLAIAFLTLFSLILWFATSGYSANPPNAPLTIRVGAYDNPPKVYRNPDGLVVGIFPDLLDMIAFEEGWQIEYVFGSWSQCLRNLENGTIDLMVDIAQSKERGQKFDFSDETVFLNWGSVYSARGTFIESFLDLRGKSVAVVRDDIHTVGENGIRQLDRNFELGLSYVEADSYREVFELLAASRADAGVVNRLFGSIHAKGYQIAQSPLIFNPVQLKFAVPKCSALGKTLIQRIDAQIAKAKQDTTSLYHEIINTYLAGIEFQRKLRGAAQAVPLTEDEKGWLERHPTVRIGVDPDYPPYSFKDPKKGYQGIAIEFMQAIGSQLGIRFEIAEDLAWPQIMEAAQNRSIDLVLPLVKTADRETYLDFSQTFLPTPLVIMARENDERLEGPEDIAGMRVALVDGYASAKRVIDEHPTIQGVMVVTPLEALKAVSVGEADCTVGVLGVNDYLARRHGISNLKVAARYDMRFFAQGFGVRKDWPELVRIIDKTLQAIPEKRKMAMINSWLPRGSGLEGPAALQEKYALTAAETDWIDRHAVIRFGVDPEFAPFEFFDKDGAFSGIVSDYVRILNCRLGLNLKVVPGLSWPETTAAVQSGAIDLLPCIAKTPEREKYLKFSTPYIHFHRVIITRTDMPFLTSLDDIRDLKVAVQSKSSHEGYLRQASTIRPMVFPTLRDALTAVSSGKADAFVGNIASATYWIRRLQLTNLKVAAPVSYAMQDLHVGVRQDWPELVRIIDKGLASISLAKENQIREHWIDVEYKPGLNPGDIWRYVLWFLGGGSIVVGIVLAWNYRLKREIAKRRVIERDLQETQNELEKRIELRTADLARSNRHLQQEIDDHRRTAIEKERLVQQLVQAQKMEAIGTMAGGIAHDFNNILMPIIGYAELALTKVPGGSKIYDYLQQIINAGHRAKGLVHQILSFSRHDEHEKRAMDLKPLVKETLKLLQSSLPATIRVNLSITADNTVIMGSPTQIHQVLMNLCTNAYHAMGEQGGELTLTVDEVRPDPDETIESDAPVQGEIVHLSVSDTGHGIDPAIQDRIFEPYFTTKPTDKGTGLGLSVVHGIIEKHGGRLSFDSAPGKGTTFHVTFPRIRREAKTEERQLSDAIRGGSETIWVVDDDVMIAQMMGAILEPLGYRVRTFRSGHGLLEAFAETTDAVDLVVTDMTMPEMTGAELAATLLEREAHLPIVLCTGFSESIDEQKANVIGIRKLLMKPIDMNDLAATIRTVLDDRPGPS